MRALRINNFFKEQFLTTILDEGKRSKWREIFDAEHHRQFREGSVSFLR